jgi:hypothetical protein
MSARKLFARKLMNFARENHAIHALAGFPGPRLEGILAAHN